MSFRIGDSVICNGFYIASHRDKKGKVIAIDTKYSKIKPFYAIEFEEDIQKGHSLEGLLDSESKRGFYLPFDDLRKLPE